MKMWLQMDNDEQVYTSVQVSSHRAAKDVHLSNESLHICVISAEIIFGGNEILVTGYVEKPGSKTSTLEPEKVLILKTYALRFHKPR